MTDGSQYKFKNKRESRIHDRLSRLISHGAADFYLDACEIVSGEALRSKSHLVAHLCREIFSSILSVTGIEGRRVTAHLEEQKLVEELIKNERLKATAHRPSEINRILDAVDALELGEDSTASQLWIAVSRIESHKFAHRVGLAPPRDWKELEDFWELSQQFLDEVLQVLENRSQVLLKKVDELNPAGAETPDVANAIVNKLRQEIPNTAIFLSRFFDKLNNPLFIQPLIRREYFLHPPSRIVDESAGTIAFPPWHLSRYLAETAKEHGEQYEEELLEACKSIPDSDNISVYQDVAVVARNIPAEVVPNSVEI